MELAEFREQTAVFAKDQPQYKPMPAHVYVDDPEGRIACCWRLTLRERLTLALTGRIWHEILTFNHPLQPQRLGVAKPVFYGPGNLVVRVNGWSMPRWGYAFAADGVTVKFNRLGNLLFRVMRWLPLAREA